MKRGSNPWTGAIQLLENLMKKLILSLATVFALSGVAIAAEPAKPAAKVEKKEEAKKAEPKKAEAKKAEPKK